MQASIKLFIPSSVFLLSLISNTNTIAQSMEEDDMDDRKPVSIQMFAPAKGDRVGIGGRGWFIDLAVRYPGDIRSSGFSSLQLTGPGVHNNAAPFPGSFSGGADDRLPGLIVLVSTTTIGAGSCQNVANLFNLTGVTDTDELSTEIWDTWLVGAANFGVNTESKVLVAVADDLNGDGIYNDAPATIPDSNGDGSCTIGDLRALGLASNIARARIFINP